MDGGRESPYGGDDGGTWVRMNPGGGFWVKDEHRDGVHLTRERGSREIRERREKQKGRNERIFIFRAFILRPKRLRFGLGEARVRVFSHGPSDPIATDPRSDPLGGHTHGTCSPHRIRPGPVSRPGDASDDVTTALTAFGTAVGPHLAAF